MRLFLVRGARELDSDPTPQPTRTKASLTNFFTPLKNLPIPKKLRIPALAVAILVIAGGVTFGLLHARLKHAAPQAKAVSSAQLGPATGPPASCSGVVRDIYRQTIAEDPGVTLAEVRSEVQNSGINCAPVAEVAAQLKDLSRACRDMVQYTFLGVRDGHPELKVNDVRVKVVQKSVACEHDRSPDGATVGRHKAK